MQLATWAPGRRRARGRVVGSLAVAMIALGSAAIAAGCAPATPRGVVTPGGNIVAGRAQLVPRERGTIVLGRFGGIAGSSAVTTMTPDGLVQWESGQGPGLGEVAPEQVAGLIGMARRDGFFTWDAEYAPEKPVADSLTTSLEITAEGRRRRVLYSSGAACPALLTELFGQVSELDVQARERPFGPDMARAILAAKALYRSAAGRFTASELEIGPPLSEEIVSGYAVDIAHDPRARVDNLPENQPKSFLSRKVRHVVELTPAGDFIQVR